MDQVYVVRHKVLVEGRGVRAVAREMGISRNTVRRYLERPQPVRVEKTPRGRPVGDQVIPRIEAILAESPRWTGGKQRLTATRLHEMLRETRADRIVIEITEHEAIDDYVRMLDAVNALRAIGRSSELR